MFSLNFIFALASWFLSFFLKLCEHWDQHWNTRGEGTREERLVCLGFDTAFPSTEENTEKDARLATLIIFVTDISFKLEYVSLVYSIDIDISCQVTGNTVFFLPVMVKINMPVCSRKGTLRIIFGALTNRNQKDVLGTLFPLPRPLWQPLNISVSITSKWYHWWVFKGRGEAGKKRGRISLPSATRSASNLWWKCSDHSRRALERKPDSDLQPHKLLFTYRLKWPEGVPPRAVFRQGCCTAGGSHGLPAAAALSGQAVTGCTNQIATQSCREIPFHKLRKQVCSRPGKNSSTCEKKPKQTTFSRQQQKASLKKLSFQINVRECNALICAWHLAPDWPRCFQEDTQTTELERARLTQVRVYSAADLQSKCLVITERFMDLQ